MQKFAAMIFDVLKQLFVELVEFDVDLLPTLLGFLPNDFSKFSRVSGIDTDTLHFRILRKGDHVLSIHRISTKIILLIFDKRCRFGKDQHIRRLFLELFKKIREEMIDQGYLVLISNYGVLIEGIFISIFGFNQILNMIEHRGIHLTLIAPSSNTACCLINNISCFLFF